MTTGVYSGNLAYPNGLSGGSGGGGSNTPAISVTVATTINISLTSAPTTIDGYTLQAGNTILVKNQTPDTGNGNPNDLIYTFTAVGSPLTLATGYTTWQNYVGLYVGIAQGATNSGKTFINNAQSGGTIGITSLLWTNQANAPITAQGSIEVIGSSTVSLKQFNASTGEAVTGVDSGGNFETTLQNLQDLGGAVTNSQTTATNLNTPSTIVSRDISGNFVANTITANLTGIASGNMPLIASPNSNQILTDNGLGQAQDSGKVFVAVVNNTSTNVEVPTALSVYNAITGAIVGVLQLQGNWNATTNTPTLTAGTGATGFAYYVSVAGTQTAPSGISTLYNKGDLVYYAGGIWNDLNYGTGSGVVSLNGQTGIIANFGLSSLTDVSESALANANILIYSTTANKWQNFIMSGFITMNSAGLTSLANTITIAQGGTGQTTASGAINALVPTQTDNAGLVLGTNGTTVSWVTGGGGSGGITAVNATGSNGIVLGSTTTNEIVNITGHLDATYSPIFISETLTANTNQLVLGTTNTQTVTMATQTANHIFTLPNANSNSVIPSVAIPNQFANGVGSSGIISYAQPSFTNLSGNITITQLPNGAVNGNSELVQTNSSGQLPALSSQLTTIGILPTLTNVALANNDSINVAMGKIQGQINVSSGVPTNNVQVATNGIDGTNLNLTINGALASLTSGGIANISPGTFIVPTSSLNNITLNGISQNSCIINNSSTANFPIANNDTIIIENLTLGNNANIIINGINNVTLTLNNVTSFNPIQIIGGSALTNLIMNNCNANIYLTGTNNTSDQLPTITLNNCITTITNALSSSTTYWVNLFATNCTISIPQWTRGNITLINPTFSGNLISTDMSNEMQINGGTTLNFLTATYYNIYKTGLAAFFITNLITDYNNNILNGNGVVKGLNNKVKNITADYTLLSYDSILNINATSGNITLELYNTDTYSTSANYLNGIEYTINFVTSGGNTLTITRVAGTNTDTINGNTIPVVLNSNQNFKLSVQNGAYNII